MKTPSDYLWWAGGYFDGLYDRERHATRVTVGPEIGRACLGIDGGLVVSDQRGKLEAGFAVRPVLAFGVFETFVRYELVGGDGLVEGGVIIKAPFHLDHRAK